VTSSLPFVVGLIPVVLLLCGMVVMDCYKLVPRRAVLLSVGIGAGAAVVAWALNQWALDLGTSPAVVKGWIAPVAEEALKMAWIAILIRRGRVGFLVDAGIHGFAIGTGFAVVENLYYAGSLGGSGLLLWMARGLGTAIMHGGAAAMAGIVARDLTERHRSSALRWFLPGYALAVAVHAGFNQLPLPPLLAAACVVVVVPMILIATYELSERQTQAWLGTTFDRDLELLELIHGGQLEDTPVGRYLASLQAHFRGPVVADMLCLLEIRAELALRAKGLLIAQGAGVDLRVDPDVVARLREFRYLERSIGPTGHLALQPILGSSTRWRWELRVLESRAET